MADPWLDFAGRLHVVAVHFPAGLATALGVAEASAVLRGSAFPHAASRPLALALAASAVLALLTGFAGESASLAPAAELATHRLWALVACAAAAAAAPLALRATRPRSPGGAPPALGAFRAAAALAVAASGGAVWTGTVAAHEELRLPAKVAGTVADPAPTAAESRAALAAVADRLRAARWHVEPLGAPDRWWADAGPAGKTGDDAALAALVAAAAPYVVELGLARTAVGPLTVAAAARAPRLARLDLSGNRLPPDALEPLRSHPSLSVLVLTDTGIGDGAARTAATLPSLRRIYAWGAGLSAAGREALRARPGAEVIE